ncbi:uncharacterized protein [Palaemon carinicauda]|uniref:uncharacterized protein n=1 Tax=Palaemon carinicauda TaxID=392227 RepID=UPI0035B5A784
MGVLGLSNPAKLLLVQPVRENQSTWYPERYGNLRVLDEDLYARAMNYIIRMEQPLYFPEIFRLFRQEPPSVPFRTIFIDHIGPYFVLHNGKKVKIWILCITCLSSRAINLKVCLNMTSGEFIRALQLHSFEYGVPELSLSDLASSLVAGANIITDFLYDPETPKFFEEQGPLHTSNDPDCSLNTDPIDTIRTSYEKLKKVRTPMIETYKAEFLNNLMTQDVHDKSRYKPVTHKKLHVGDIVLIKEENYEPNDFPLAVVKDIKTNVIDEVTDQGDGSTPRHIFNPYINFHGNVKIKY